MLKLDDTRKIYKFLIIDSFRRYSLIFDIPTSRLARLFLTKGSSSVPLIRHITGSNCFLFLVIVFTQISSWRSIRFCAKLRPHVLHFIRPFLPLIIN